jgi:hypothetical protein
MRTRAQRPQRADLRVWKGLLRNRRRCSYEEIPSLSSRTPAKQTPCCRVPHSFAVFANEWARRTALVIKFLHRTAFNFERPLLIIHSHCCNFTVKDERKLPHLHFFRSFHQSALYRITVRVTAKYNAGLSFNIDRNNWGCAISRAFRESLP